MWIAVSEENHIGSLSSWAGKKENRINKFSGAARTYGERGSDGRRHIGEKLAQSEMHRARRARWERESNKLTFFNYLCTLAPRCTQCRYAKRDVEQAQVNGKKSCCLFVRIYPSIGKKYRALGPSILYYETWCRRNKHRSGTGSFLVSSGEIFMYFTSRLRLYMFLWRLMISGGSFSHVKNANI